MHSNHLNTIPCTHSVGKHNTVQHHKPAHRAHKFRLPGKSICPCDHLFLSLFFFHFILFLFLFYLSILLYILSYFIVFTYTHLLFLLAVCPATLQPGPLHSCHTHKRLLFTHYLLFYCTSSPVVFYCGSRLQYHGFTILFAHCIFSI
jgi:hypothetical protein